MRALWNFAVGQTWQGRIDVQNKSKSVLRDSRKAAAPRRSAAVERKTRETSVSIDLALDGSGRGEARTGVPFLDHMLESFARHGFFDLTIKAAGDLHIDDHHTVEDVGIVLGRAFREALGDRSGIKRFGE